MGFIIYFIFISLFIIYRIIQNAKKVVANVEKSRMGFIYWKSWNFEGWVLFSVNPEWQRALSCRLQSNTFSWKKRRFLRFHSNKEYFPASPLNRGWNCENGGVGRTSTRPNRRLMTGNTLEIYICTILWTRLYFIWQPTPITDWLIQILFLKVGTIALIIRTRIPTVTVLTQ